MPDIDKPHKTGHNWLDIVIGVAVIAISIASLWVAAGESRTQEKILAASVWPYMQFGSSNVSTTGDSEVDFIIENAGVGPAHVKWFTMYYKDKPYATIRELLMACCGVKSHDHLWTLTSGLQGNVLTAHETVNFIHLPASKNTIAVVKKIDKERHNVYVRACFCSVLNDCWLFDSREDEPAPLKACPKAEEPVFQG